jgi:hypothetical protein
MFISFACETNKDYLQLILTYLVLLLELFFLTSALNQACLPPLKLIYLRMRPIYLFISLLTFISCQFTSHSLVISKTDFLYFFASPILPPFRPNCPIYF